MDHDPILTGSPVSAREVVAQLRIVQKEQFDALAERDEIIAQAKADAAHITEQAQTEAAQLRAAALLEMDRARAEAVNEGFNAGWAQWEKGLATVEVEVQRIVADQAAMIVRLASTLAVRILKDELTATPEKLGNILREVLQENLPESCQTILVNPSQTTIIERALAQWGRPNAKITIQPDRRVAVNDLRLEYRFGMVDARVETLIASGAAAILRRDRK